MNPLVSELLDAAGEVFQAVEGAAHSDTPAIQEVPTDAIQANPVVQEVAQGVQAVGEIASGDAVHGIQDAAAAAAQAIAQNANPDAIHQRLTQAESWIATWHPVLQALAKEFGIEPPTGQ